MGTEIQVIGHGNATPDRIARSCNPRSRSFLKQCFRASKQCVDILLDHKGETANQD